jgi:hypothetical protein
VSPDSPAARFLGWDGWPTVAVVAVVVAALLTVALVVRAVRRLRARFRRGPVEVVLIQMRCSDGWDVDLPWEVEVRRSRTVDSSATRPRPPQTPTPRPPRGLPHRPPRGHPLPPLTQAVRVVADNA